jgi:nucleoside 2-deoxyribosyltransferase
MRIYFAGPLFTPYERSFIDECAARLRAEGIEVFVPHENALALPDTRPATIFAKDWTGLSTADAVVALLDGPMVDDGTACEIGIFYGLLQSDPAKKGIVGMTHDLRYTRDSNREGEVKGLNLFVVGCIEAAGTIVTSLDDAHAILDRWRT